MEQIIQLRRGPHGHAVAGADIARDEARVERQDRDGLEVEGLAADLSAAVRGEVRFDRASRALYATDASNYRYPPIGVVVPADEEDVVAAVAVARRHGAPVLGRGGGTSLAGQCCNTAIVIDCSKYLNRVKRIDRAARRAVVQPGCILDDLRSDAKRFDLTWGPDPSTHDHCTLGGMIGNDACGVHAMMAEIYGPGPRTEDGVAELEILTYDGLRMRVGPTSESEIVAKIRAGGREGEIYRDLRALRDRYADDIRHGFPDIPRRVSGYNLPALLPEQGFDLARALVGTESTCVLILEATLRLMVDIPERALLILGYPSVYEAGDHIAELRALGPTGLEGLDDRLAHFIRKKKAHADDLALLPEGKGWLLLEVGGASRAEAVERAQAAKATIERWRSAPRVVLVTDPDAMQRVWKIRESGLGATAFVPGEPDTWEGWEDAAVPPHRVGDYLRAFRTLLEEHGYACSLYGHFGQGCIHTRIDFRFDPEGIARYRRFTRAAADLVVRFGGSLSGEHGDGQSRADLLDRMYSPRIMEAFRAFKRVWDPAGKMNPGKVVDPHPRTAGLRLADWDPPHQRTHFAFAQDGGDFAHAALRCVGVGECRKTSAGTMCPSYMVTREEKHSTRGRSHLLFEMLTGEVLRDGWASREVEEALDLCLACKACKHECPVSVDMATYKAEFLAHHYRTRRRPLHAYAFGWIDRWARLAALAPGLVNLLVRLPGVERIAKRIAGIAPERAIPRFASSTFKARFFARPPAPSGQPVILWPDTFNNFFLPDTLMAMTEVLEAAGFRPIVPRAHLCCGRALFDYGMLDTARSYYRRILRVLREPIRAGVPVVGAEPSCLASLRDELVGLLPNDDDAARLCRQTYTLSELLAASNYEPPRLAGRALVHGHCHHRAVLDFESEVALMRQMGLDLEVLDAGCCGMAGAFGFMRDHYEVSMAAAERVLLPAVRSRAGALVVADGFSCREQVLSATGERPLHLAEVIHRALAAPALPKGTP